MFLNQGSQIYSTPNSITGGTNGVGLKTTFRFSSESMLATVDPTTNRYYVNRFSHKGAAWFKTRSQVDIANSKQFSRDNMPFNFLSERCEVFPPPGSAPLPALPVMSGEPLEMRADKPFTLIRIKPRFDSFDMTYTHIYALQRAVEGRLYELSTILRAPIFFNGTKLPPVLKSHGGLDTFIRLSHGYDDVAMKADVHQVVLDPESMGDIRRLSPTARKLIFTDPVRHRFALQVAVVLRGGHSGLGLWACINGVVLRLKNSLTDHFVAQIIAGVAKHLGGKITPADFTNEAEYDAELKLRSERHKALITGSLSLYICGFVPCPTWGSQSKNGSTMSIADSDAFLAPYVLPDSFIAPITKRILATMSSLRDQEIVQESMSIIKEMKSKRRKPTCDWESCDMASMKKPWSVRQNATLFVSEGQSAESVVRTGLKVADCPLQLGASAASYALQGVPMNARQFCIVDKATGRKIPTPDLARNEVWTNFVLIMGLDYLCDYVSQAEIETLTFGKIIIATDQDVDGEGKITSLVLNFLDVFWPALIKRGMIYRLATDLIRVFEKPTGSSSKKRLLACFYTEADFRTWALERHYYGLLTDDIYSYAATLRITSREHVESALSRLRIEHAGQPVPVGPAYEAAIDASIKREIDSKSKSSARLNVQYYKGLGKHGNGDLTKDMFGAGRFWQNIIGYTYDEHATLMFAKFFESSSEPRKLFLRTIPPRGDEVIDGRMTCTTQLMGPYRLFCRSDMIRKLPNIIDGMNDIKRRILHGALLYFGSKSKHDQVNVASVAGEIGALASYHHEPEILQDTIVRLTQSFFGSRRFPFFIGYGNFGHRNNPRAAETRYVDIALNYDVVHTLFPPADLALLTYMFEDGKRSIPNAFCPIIPPIFEQDMMPSHGWQINTQAIDVYSLINITRALVSGTVVLGEVIESNSMTPSYRTMPMPHDTNGWRGKLVKLSNVWLSFGVCSLHPVGAHFRVVISELPIGLTSDVFIKELINLGKQVIDEGTIQKPIRREVFIEHPFIADFVGKESIKNVGSSQPKAPNEIHIEFVVRGDKVQSFGTASFKESELTGSDAFMHHIGLTRALHNQLNFMQTQPDGSSRILELQSYYDIVEYWYPVRKQLYHERLERERTLAIFERAMLAEIQRAFLEDIPRLFMGTGPGSKDLTEVEMTTILEQKGFFRFAHGLIQRPKYLSTASLPLLITGYFSVDDFERAFAASRSGVIQTAAAVHGDALADEDADSRASHAYILNLNMRQAAHRQKRQTKIDELTARIAQLSKPGYWAEVWLGELARFEAICRENLPNLWTDKTGVEFARADAAPKTASDRKQGKAAKA